MRNFDNTSNKRSFRGKDFQKGQFGNRDKERSQMHEVVCSDCGKRCEVPFKPTGDKPVYCSQCFTNHGGGQTSNRFEKRDRERPRFQDKRMFDAICDKCGKRCELPFRPTGDKPVYCSQCFGRDGDSPNKNNDKVVSQHKEQFDMLNTKLDRIINFLAMVAPVEEEKNEVAIKKKEVITKKKVKVKKPKQILIKKSVATKKNKKNKKK